MKKILLSSLLIILSFTHIINGEPNRNKDKKYIETLLDYETYLSDSLNIPLELMLAIKEVETGNKDTTNENGSGRYQLVWNQSVKEVVKIYKLKNYNRTEIKDSFINAKLAFLYVKILIEKLNIKTVTINNIDSITCAYNKGYSGAKQVGFTCVYSIKVKKEYIKQKKCIN